MAFIDFPRATRLLSHARGELVAAVEAQLAEKPGLRRLHLECARLQFCDTMGLSALPAIRRRAAEAGIQLQLDELSPTLHRLLR